jgi:HTH-type transcriptional regulator / antitoxin HigA
MIRHPLRNEPDYRAALVAIESYFIREPEPGAPEADDFDLLALLIEDYEQRIHPVPPPEPLAAIQFKMDIMGYTQAELGAVIGSRQRASDVLRGKRALSLAMIRALHQKWDIPLECLVAPMETAA